MSSKPTYEELERDHAFLFAAYKQTKQKLEELEGEFIKLESLVEHIHQASGSYIKAKLDSVPEAEDKD